MGCNCNKPKPAARPRPYPETGAMAKQEFTLVRRDGSTATFGSQLEANAENARNGYTGTVKPKGKS